MSSSSKTATRKAYGEGLIEIGKKNSQVVVLDAETSNSTFAYKFKEVFPDRFIECYIAEQNMISTALGMSKMGKIPFVSTFGAFLSRAHDQIRMAQYANPNIKIIGSHSGVSIGEDGSSQMALEDLAMFRSILKSVVFYPSDYTSCKKLVNLMAETEGLQFMRTTRADTEILYDENEEFTIGGSKIIKSSDQDAATVIGAGITLHEALKAYQILSEKNIKIRVIDLYSIKPVDSQTIQKALAETNGIIVVEDHFVEGGVFEAVVSDLVQKNVKINKPVKSLAVQKMPMSGKPAELLEYEQIDAKAIATEVEKLI